MRPSFRVTVLGGMLTAAVAFPALADPAPPTTPPAAPGAAAPAPAPAPAPANAPAAGTPASAARTADASSAPPAAAAPDKLVILFGDGSASIGPQGLATLDQASRLYRAGNPIVMVVTGTTDATGNPDANLHLSERRAENVLNGLVARGIPVAKLQLLAAGSTDPAVKGGADAAEPANRRAVITWR